MRAWLGSLICLTVGLGFLMSGSPRLNEIDGSFGPVILSSGTIVSGGSLSQSLVREGISNPEAYKIEKALKGYFNPRASRPGDLYEIFKSSAGDFLKLQYWPNRLEYFTVEKSSSGILLAGREKVALRQRLMGIQGKIKTSLWEAMMEQGVPPDVIYRFAEVFAWKIDFLTEPRRGDTYKMVWVRRSAEGAAMSLTSQGPRSSAEGAVLDGDVLCAQYHGWETGRVFAFRMGDEYYDMEGRSLRGEFLRAPLSYRRISSYFSNRRFHPILRYYRPHHGVDYAAAYGTPVVSVGAGKVIAVGWDKGLGRAVRVRHLNGYVSIYGHLSGYSGKIKVGSNIQQGQLVGTVGSSGLSSGPHLHLGFEKDGQMVNFLRLRLKPGRTVVAQKDRENFNRIKRESYTLLAQIFRHSSQPESLESPFFLTQLNNSSDALKVR